MILAKVLVGTYQVNTDLADLKETELRPDGFEYDSVVDDLTEPNIFVIFRDYKALPLYIIEYSTNF